MKRYISSEFLCESDSLEIRELAKKIIKNKNNKEEQVKKIFYWVRDNFIWDIRKIVGAKKLIKCNSKFAMSFDKSNLFVALCRSIGIPTRFILIKCSFYNKYKKDYDISLHAPAEVYINGKWIIADCAFGPHTSKIADISQFGKKTWKKLYSKKTTSHLPFFIPLIFNNIMLPLSTNIRRLQKEVRACQEL